MVARGRPVKIVGPDPGWPAAFAAEARALAAFFPPDTVRFEHVGSTAVPGLSAKPIIDILAGATRLVVFEQAVGRLAEHGYAYVPEFEAELPQRRFFRCAERSIHLHAVVHGEAFWTEHLRFRDRLRASPGLAAEYEALKHRLAERHRMDSFAYARAKTPFVRRVLASDEDPSTC